MRPRHWLLIPLAIAVAIAGIIWGGKNSYVSLHNRSPLEMTCAQYEAHPPDVQWLRLRECILDFDHASVESTKGSSRDASAAFIPLRSPNLRRSAPATLILAIDEGPMLSQRIVAEDEAVDAWMFHVREHGIEGVIELAIDRSERTKKQMRDFGMHAEDTAAIMAYGAAPRPLGMALGALAIGIGALAWLVWRLWPRTRGTVELPRAQIVQT